MKHFIVNLAKRLERLESKPVAIVARTLYLPLLLLFAIIIKTVEGLCALWENKDEVKQWVLTGETPNS
jgi:hypothetical protein